MEFGLPTTVDVCGVTYPINTDYRDILNICIALSDCELSEQEKAFVALCCFYPTFGDMPEESYAEAVKACFRFINLGDDEQPKSSIKLVDWEQDFQYIVSPINRVVGKEIRSVEYMHWWTFISAYYEIGDCLFAQIVRIRDAKAHGKKLDKADKEWLNKNGHLVNFKHTYSQAENETIDAWTKGCV